MGALLGIEISQRTHGNSARTPAIWFELHVQGAGACYEAHYTYQADAVAKIKAEAPDTKLAELAERLTVAQTTLRLLWGDTIKVAVQANNRYSHSSAMQMAWRRADDDSDAEIDGADLAHVEEIQKVLREFADWIYHQLEAEFDYQVSDECVDEYLSEKSFTGDGEEIA
jgi:hypothetical protein